MHLKLFHIREQNPPTLLAGGNVNYFSLYGEQYGDFPRVLKVDLTYVLVIPLLSIYPDKRIIQKDTHSLMFIEALYAKCSSQDMKTTYMSTDG